mmetsp:Transcript_20635/g.39199  ORF Transcript_20635/g.39199 Transcript_20635/m.39199 type:complete len:101 (+) Transcript_20635:128-430(+)
MMNNSGRLLLEHPKTHVSCYDAILPGPTKAVLFLTLQCSSTRVQTADLFVVFNTDTTQNTLLQNQQRDNNYPKLHLTYEEHRTNNELEQTDQIAEHWCLR